MAWLSRLIDNLWDWFFGYTEVVPSYSATSTPVLEKVPTLSTNPKPMETNAERFVRFTKEALGECLWRGTGVSPEVACAISVNVVHDRAFGESIGGGASTQALYNVLKTHPDFTKVTLPQPGCIVISPTGYGTKPKYPHGHVGIVGNYGICSNDSSSGRFSENYTVDSWNRQFHDVEGYPVYYFLRN